MHSGDLSETHVSCCTAPAQPFAGRLLKPLTAISYPVPPRAGGLEGPSVFQMPDICQILCTRFGSGEIISVISKPRTQAVEGGMLPMFGEQVTRPLTKDSASSARNHQRGEGHT